MARPQQPHPHISFDLLHFMRKMFILFLYRFIHYLYTGYTFSGEESFCLPGSTEISLAIQNFTLKPEKICRHGKIVGTSWPMNANLYVFVGSI